MKYCRKCGNQIDDEAVICPKCGVPQEAESNNRPIEVDTGGFGWFCLGCCIPVVGLVLYLIWKDSKPNTAKTAGMGALITAVVIIVYYVLIAVFGVNMADY